MHGGGKLAKLHESIAAIHGEEEGQLNSADDIDVNDDGYTNRFANGDDESVVVLLDQQNENLQQMSVRYGTYAHDGRFWHVPKTFEFPSGLRLDTAWKSWLSGMSGNETIVDGVTLWAPI